MASLKEQIREAVRIAEEACETNDFNAMSWLDIALEDTPEFFDGLFDTAWNELSGSERSERCIMIRKVL